MPEASSPAPSVVFLRTRSRKQALEWSLVLVSQGVESAVTRERAGWGLELDPSVADRARQILEVYRCENRLWFRLHRPITEPWGCDARVVFWMLGLTLIHALQLRSRIPLEALGCADTRALAQGEYWRLVTATTLHADPTHLAGNLVFGGLLLGLAMRARGVGWALLSGLAGGVFGNLASWIVHPGDHVGLGASGVVMAALGLLATAPAVAGNAGSGSRWIRALLGALMLVVILGFDPASDVVAHLGGFAAGVAAGGLLLLGGPRFRESAWANGLAACLSCGGVAISWGLAIASSRPIH